MSKVLFSGWWGEKQSWFSAEWAKLSLIFKVLDTDTDHLVLVDFGDFGIDLGLDPRDHVLLLLLLKGVLDSDLKE